VTKRWLAVLTVAVLAAAACGRSDDEQETGGGTEEEGGGTEDTQAAGGAGSFGDLAEICSDGDASGSTAQGVTDSEIAIGTVSDPGFAGRPGLNQELFDAAEVFAAWCNEAGGINGRQITVNQRDAKLTEFRQRVIESCREDFMMVGGGAVFDDTGQEERLECLLPNIAGFVVTSQAKAADLTVQPVPNVLDQILVAAQLYAAERFPDSVEKVGYLTGNVPATVLVNRQKIESGEGLGFTTVYNGQYNAAGESSWTPFAQEIQSEEVKGLQWTGEPENLAKLLQALADIGYELDWVASDANHVDQKLIDTGGGAVRNVFIAGSVVPYTRAEDNEATQQYLDLFEEHLPDGKSEAYLGFQAFSAWLLFANAAKECGAELTRRCVFDNASAVRDWTGGGLHAATDPGSGEIGPCALVTEATSEGFVEAEEFETTDGLFNCNPDHVYDLEGDYGRGVTLEDVGKSIDELE
jgi:ABC-type branched-subunit amino acid transport system substrate-binding protein